MNIKVSVLTKAISVAKKSNVIRGKVGAVIFTRSGRIVASASNTVFYGHKNKWTIHAEDFAIRKCFSISSKVLRRLYPLYLLVVRYSKEYDTLAMARPCKKCEQIIRGLGIITFYSDKDGTLKKLL